MQLLCGKCGGTVEVDEGQSGAEVPCEKCGNNISIPKLADEGLEPNALEYAGEDDGFAGQAKEAMEKKIRVLCGACGRGLKASMRMAGQKVRCPACNKKILIPYPDEEVKAPDADGIAAEAEEKAGQRTGKAEKRQAELVGAEAKAGARKDLRETTGPAAASLAEDEQDEVGILLMDVGESAGATLPEARTPHVPTWIMLGAVGMALLALGMWLWLDVFAPRPAAPSDGGGSTNGGKQVAVDAGGGQAAVPGTTKANGPKPPADAHLGTVRLIGNGKLDVFAGSGRGVAQPDSLFLHLRLTVRAGTEALDIQLPADVVLRVGRHTIASLGRPDAFGRTNRSASQRIRIGPGAVSDVFAVVFRLPEQLLGEAETAVVGITGAKPLTVQGLKASRGPRKLAAGVYREKRPRNLKPLLRDPVMRAIQSAPDHQLVVHDDGGGSLALSIPRAGVSGQAHRGDNGVYEATLAKAGEAATLECKLRPFDGGKRLLLYLADEPFHQLTYALPKWEPTPGRIKAKDPKPGKSSKGPAKTGKKPGKSVSVPTYTGKKTIFDH